MSDQEKEGQETDGEEAKKAEALELPAFYGVKAGMTRIFGKNGNHIPVTVIKLISNKITQVKTMENDGYEAYQVAYGEKRAKLLNSPTKGHLAKASVEENFSQLKK